MSGEKRIPLDDIGLFFLREIHGDEGNIERYIVDAERAEDSHYELAPKEAEKLRRQLAKMYGCGSLEDGLRALFAEHGHDIYLRGLMIRTGVRFQEYHFY